mmetsp:Transcript_76527/g.241989  ORF Transcript_76527/g.241989 Transcript_76527/m.241989 type:complete len:235 (-) Transcript_76527:571-1275(-)
MLRNSATSVWLKPICSMALMSRTTACRSLRQARARRRCSTLQRVRSGLSPCSGSSSAAMTSFVVKRASFTALKTTSRSLAVDMGTPSSVRSLARLPWLIVEPSLPPCNRNNSLKCSTSSSEKPACLRLWAAKALLRLMQMAKKSSNDIKAGTCSSHSPPPAASRLSLQALAHPRALTACSRQSSRHLPTPGSTQLSNARRIPCSSISRWTRMRRRNSPKSRTPSSLMSTSLIML